MTPSAARTITPAGTLTVQPFVVPGVLLFSLVLIQAPVLFGANASIWAYGISLAPFCAAIVSLALMRARWWAATPLWLAIAYVMLLVAAAFRGGIAGAMSFNSAVLEAVQLTLLATVGMFAFLREPRESQRARYLRALCWAPVVFLATNLALYVAGVLPAGQYTADSRLPATMLGLIGVHVNRVQFPLASGLNGIGPTAVVALVVCSVLAVRNEQRKRAVAGTLLSLCVVLLIDSRGALLFGLLALALVTLTPRARKRGFGWVAILLPVLPIVLILALTNLAETEVGSELDRGGVESLSTGTGRTVVWGAVIKVFRPPAVEHVFGYGQNGHITSGASLNYAYLFPNEPDALAHSAHNLLLQTLLDTGWIGLACLIALAVAVLNRLARLAADSYYAALLAAALALLLLGIVQADPTPVHPDSFAFWILLLFAALRGRPLTRQPRTSETRSPSWAR